MTGEQSEKRYKLALDVYKAYKISQNFYQAVDLAIKLNDWSTFIGQYGTHYITEVLFGGRAIQESEFTRTSVATLKEKGIDVGLAVKASYAGFYGEASSDVSISNQQKTEAESLKKKTSNYYIGGAPPKNGNIQEWQRIVKSQPMPIYYKVMPLSDLFAASPGKSSDWANTAKQTFYKALDTYCSGKCKTPQPDKPLPAKHSNVFSYTSPLFGGNGGTFYQWNQFVADWHVSRFRIRSGVEIDGLQIFASHRDSPWTVVESGFYGGQGGGQDLINVQSGDWINKIDIRFGSRVDSLTFYTNKGLKYRYGGQGGDPSTIIPPTTNYRWTGIVGKSGASLDKIGFIFTLTVWDVSHTHAHQITKVIYPEEQ